MNIDQLTEEEKVAYVRYAKANDKWWNKSTLRQLRKQIKRAEFHQDLNDLHLMVLDRRAQLLGDKGGHCPCPKRKAAQAMKLAFPKYRIQTLHLGG